MDISMPDMNGALATRRIKELLPAINVLALTAHEDSSYLRHMLEASAAGFLLKRAAADQLIQAIHVVAADDRCVANEDAVNVCDRVEWPSRQDADDHAGFTRAFFQNVDPDT